MVRRRPKFPKGLKIVRKRMGELSTLKVFVNGKRVGTIIRHSGVIPRWEVIDMQEPANSEWFHQLPNAVLWACMLD